MKSQDSEAKEDPDVTERSRKFMWSPYILEQCATPIQSIRPPTPHTKERQGGKILNGSGGTSAKVRTGGQGLNSMRR